jgi:hypothetical protein
VARWGNICAGRSDGHQDEMVVRSQSICQGVVARIIVVLICKCPYLPLCVGYTIGPRIHDSLCLRFQVLDMLIDKLLLVQDVRADMLGPTDLAETFLA